LFFLQYMLLPGDRAYRRHVRQQFRDKRGPEYELWLNALTSGTISSATIS
jgi:hypothetical protein